MQVNLNTNINQSRPQFGKLKAIEFSHGIDGSVLENDISNIQNLKDTLR